MHPTITSLLHEAPILTDGAWGTELQERGLTIGQNPDVWNLRHPEIIRDIARAYVEAGSRIILTNTFGANRISLRRYLLEKNVEEINRRGVELSKACARDTTLVFASMGPSGKMFALGDITEEHLSDAFAEQASAIAAAGADGIVIETMSDLTEASIALRAAKKTSLPVVVCMSFDSGREKDRTMMGITPEYAATVLTEIGADVLGINCGQGIDTLLPLCRRMQTVSDLPLWIKANAGIPSLVNGKAEYSISPKHFVDAAIELVGAGAHFIGGCCGTSPEFIHEISLRLRRG